MKKKFFAFFGATVILFAMLLGIYVKYIRYDSYMVFVESFDHRNAGKKCEAPSDTVIKSSYLLNGEFDKLPKKLGDV